MGAHEQLEKVLTWSPRTKVIAALSVLACILGVSALLVFAGYRWAKSNAEAERTAQDDKIAVLTASGERHLANVTQLTAENALLKKQNEAKAEAAKQADTERERKALADQAQRDSERAAKFSEIDADLNFDSQLCATCREYTERGFKLSFCPDPRCKDE